jgi:CheY-like chemotaxis protein
MTSANKLVLVADDYDDAAALLAELLRLSTAFDTMVAKDGREALGQALARRPDVAILDIDMPHIGGIEAAWALRVAFEEHRPLLIAMTGGSYAEAMLSGMFDHVLRKPIIVDELLTLLRDL